MSIWIVTTGGKTYTVEAQDQHEAFDTLRGRKAEEFGMIASAKLEGTTDEESFPIRTSALFGRWGDRETALRFIERAKELGLGDTSAVDLPRRYD